MGKNYSKFAKVYSAGSYPAYSRFMAERLPDALGRLSYRAKRVLDLACGEGTFALEAEELGFEVTGVDRSEEMVEIAREKTEEAGADANFLQGDMRELSLQGDEFDLVTSWFDSMNYLLTEFDFKKALKTAYDHLRNGGFFIFDVNTIHGLREEWQREECYVQRDDSEVFEIHRTNYNPSRQIAELKITFFRSEAGKWERHEEVHKERGFELGRIKELATDAGFEVRVVWDDLEEFTPPEEESGRVWVALHKETPTQE